ncbi:MAG: ATPase [Treponema sp.]|nr:ATPase [Treponema sp.]
MIVPMKKVSLVILDSEKNQALKQLRSLGVVHLEDIEGKGETLAAFKATSETLMNATMMLAEVKVPKKFAYEEVSNETALEKAKRVLEIQDRKKELFDVITGSTSELDRFAGWGTFDPKDFDYLKKEGINLSLYEIPSDKMSLITDDVKVVVVNQTKAVTRFLLVSEKADSERPEGLPPEAFNVVLPEKSTDEIMADIKNAEKELDDLQKEFNDSVKYVKSIKEYYALIQKDIEFENICSGMESEGCDENKLSWVTGYVPVDSYDNLAACAKENAWAIACDDPSEEDNVPTKLKNNKLVSLIYPLTDFLGTVPGYREYDISGWFLLFFTVFFGMIFGDGGYGLLVTVISLIMILKSMAGKKKVSPMLGLVFLVGLATVGWGLVTCTWFGIPFEKLPAWLVNLSIPQISNAYADKIWTPFWITDKSIGLTNAQNLQIFCFTLALLQLSVAHVKAIGANIKSPKFLGDLGALLQLWGMFYVVLSMVVSSTIFPLGLVIESIPVGQVAICLIAVGFGLSFIFSNYAGSVIKSILESCKNIISVLLGVVNVFSDIVSYIRLWAVGLAGAAISSTVNSMAGPMLGHAILFIAAVALLGFGHGLNMILNLLSVIVHGVRLNTLEFSTHLGMSWSGFKYEPFSEKAE